MKKWNLLALVFVFSTLLCLVGSGAAYSGGTMIELDTLPGYAHSWAYGINNSGQIVGYTWGKAFLYSGGKMTNLGTLGGTSSCAYGINNSGQIVGHVSMAPGEAQVFLYSGGEMTNLGLSGLAYGINDSGQIVGCLQLISGLHAFLYSSGTTKDLGKLLGGENSIATGINSSGQIVGYSYYTSNPTAAFLYSGGMMKRLNPPNGGTTSYAHGINDIGQVVGYFYSASGRAHAFLYSGGEMIDLGTPPWDIQCEATGINNSGQIVGYSYTTGYFNAFLYFQGKWTQLGTIPGGTHTIPTSINNSGQIVGYSTLTSGINRAFLYTPDLEAILSVSPTSLSPICVKGKNATSQNFTVQNTGAGGLSYTITKDADWLSVTPTSGTSTGEQDIITVNYATSGLASGKYNATITISASGATGTPKTIGVALTVKPPSIAPLLLLLLD